MTLISQKYDFYHIPNFLKIIIIPIGHFFNKIYARPVYLGFIKMKYYFLCKDFRNFA
jgi:hypothetical protein